MSANNNRAYVSKSQRHENTDVIMHLICTNRIVFCFANYCVALVIHGFFILQRKRGLTGSDEITVGTG